MNTPLPHKGASPHPMIIIAALAIVLFCLVGTAAIMGWIPSSIGGNSAAKSGALSASGRADLAAGMPAPASAGVAADQAALANTAPVQPAPAAKEACLHCGTIESVREITTRAEGSGVGAAGGAILGGLLGNQIGGGGGRQLATVAAAVGGAVVGNRVEGNMNARHSYDIRVRLDDGATRTFHQQNAPGWHDGERVRVVNGALRSVR